MDRNLLSFIKNAKSKTKTTLELLQNAQSEIECGRLAAGRDGLLKAFQECKDPFLRVVAAYNLGATYWANIGDGNNARKFYQLAVEEAEKSESKKVNQEMKSILANTYENLMHLSLAYEEYFEWAAKLRKLQPTDDVLRGMVPGIQEKQTRGVPWSTILEVLAANCYDRSDPSLDRGEYARAVATYHLILLNRKPMRLPREAWGRITYEYGTLALRVASDAGTRMEHSKQAMDTAEFGFIVTDALRFVDEYQAANPADNEAQSLLKHMNGFLHDADHAEARARIAVLNDEGVKMLGRQEFGGALSKFIEAEQICREIGDEARLQACIGNLALVALNTGDPRHALVLNAEKEEICRRIGFNSGLAYALANKAAILASLHRTSEAIVYAEEASQLCVQYGMEDLAREFEPVLNRMLPRTR